MKKRRSCSDVVLVELVLFSVLTLVLFEHVQHLLHNNVGMAAKRHLTSFQHC